MNDDFLTDSLMMYIGREIAEKFTIDSIIDNLWHMQEHQVMLWYMVNLELSFFHPLNWFLFLELRVICICIFNWLLAYGFIE